MLNRRHLRIKILQILYAYFQKTDSRKDVPQAIQELDHSLEKMYDQYIFWLLTFNELVFVGERRIEDGKNKRLPSEDDLNPNTKFIDNRVFGMLKINMSLKSLSEARSINWVGDENAEVFRKLYATIRNSDLYLDYMESSENSFKEDLEFAKAIFKEFIANDEMIHHIFEEQSVYWLDDMDLICSMVLKTIKSLKADSDEYHSLLTLYRDKDDEKDFIKKLMSTTIKEFDENQILIEKLAQNWEVERIATIDILLMQMAIAELKSFSNIPKKVTLNEYIEISKIYSTPKSNGFINGILDKAIVELEKDNKINKTGRGLIQ